MKAETLKLADDIANGIENIDRAYLSAMIRRLVEELDKQCKPINHYEPTAWINHIKQTGGDFYELNVSGRGEPLYRHPPQTKPLSDEEINKVASIKMNQILMDLIDSEDWNKGCTKQHLVNFARAIEERHGIK